MVNVSLYSAAQAPQPDLLPTPHDAARNRQVLAALKALNQAQLIGEHNEFTFVLDRATRRLTIQIVNRTTKEVVEQIPAEYVLQVAEALEIAAPGRP